MWRLPEIDLLTLTESGNCLLRVLTGCLSGCRIRIKWGGSRSLHVCNKTQHHSLLFYPQKVCFWMGGILWGLELYVILLRKYFREARLVELRLGIEQQAPRDRLHSAECQQEEVTWSATKRENSTTTTTTARRHQSKCFNICYLPLYQI